MEQAYKDLIMELDVLTTVGKHQNLVEFYGACVQDPTNPVILEELVEGPNLEYFLEVIFVEGNMSGYFASYSHRFLAFVLAFEQKKKPGFNLGRTTIFR